MRRLVALGIGLLLLWAGNPAGATATVTPRLSMTVNPRYPQLGQRAQLTVHVGGARGAATGWVRFRFDGALIAGCTHVVLHAGTARCTAPASWRAERTFVAGYKGSSVYRAAALTRHAWS